MTSRTALPLIAAARSALETAAAALAAAEAAAADETPQPDHPQYADATCNPYGAQRPFADAARRGDFATFRRARKVTALWADVLDAMHSRTITRRLRRAPVANDATEPSDADLLASGGIRLGSGRAHNIPPSSTTQVRSSRGAR